MLRPEKEISVCMSSLMVFDNQLLLWGMVCNVGNAGNATGCRQQMHTTLTARRTCPNMQMSAAIRTVLLFPPMLGPVTTKHSPLLPPTSHNENRH